MSDNVVNLFNHVDPDTVLTKAVGNYSNVLVIGYDKNGELDVRADSGTSHERCSFLATLFIQKLCNGDYSGAR